MKKKSSGALCRSCQDRARDPTETMPRAELEKDVWAAADGGVGSSDSEDETLYAEKTTTGIVVNHKAYEKLGNSVGGEGQVIYDSSDDD